MKIYVEPIEEIHGYYEILKRISEITLTRYVNNSGYIKVEDLLSALEDLLSEYEGLKEEYEDYKKQIENPREYYED